jgi:hypothetical protein
VLATWLIRRRARVYRIVFRFGEVTGYQFEDPTPCPLPARGMQLLVSLAAVRLCGTGWLESVARPSARCAWTSPHPRCPSSSLWRAKKSPPLSHRERGGECDGGGSGGRQLPGRGEVWKRRLLSPGG